MLSYAARNIYKSLYNLANKMSIVIHFSEIILKGKNRPFFERILVNNIRASLDKNIVDIRKEAARIVCEVENEDVKVLLEKIPGIANFSFAIKSRLDINDFKEISLNILKNRTFASFKIETRRSNKGFMQSSTQINEQVGEYIVKNLNKVVKLKNPEITLNIEIGNKEAFLYVEKYQGIGGLPVGSSDSLICSLSGGLDSPVSSYMMMKRGCRIVFVHIYNPTQVNKGLLTKIKDIVKQLSTFQNNSKLYIVPFDKIQKEIMKTVPSKVRMIVYRRFMLKIMNKIAEKEKIRAIVTGDSLGQVASQTIPNLNVIYEASELPIFPPLIGMNKEEIINISRQIGTYDYSILAYPDCCSFMIAEHPEIKAELVEIKKVEANIQNQEDLIKEAFCNSEIFMLSKQVN